MTQEQLEEMDNLFRQRMETLYELHQINYRSYRLEDHIDLQEQQLDEDLV